MLKGWTIAVATTVLLAGCSEATPPPEELPPLVEDDRNDDNPADDPGGETPEEPEEPVNPNCNPSNCAGCCNGDLCVEGTDDDSCGLGGEICSSCGEDFWCSQEQVCSLRPDITWALVAKSGTVSAKTLADGDWDGDGNLPDPYIEVSSDDWYLSYTTYEDGNTLTPVWEYAVLWNTYTDVVLSPLEITVWDKDGNADDFMGSCELQITEEQMISGEDIVVQCDRNQVEDDAGWTVTFYVVTMEEYWNY